MPIAFEQIPSDILVPLFYAEVVPAPTPFANSLRMVLIGEMRPTFAANGKPDTPYILSKDNAGSLFGRGSPLYNMYLKARQNLPFGEIWGVGMSTAAGSVNSTGKIQVINSPTRIWSGTMRLWLGGQPVGVNVRPTDTQVQVASRLAAAINSNPTQYLIAVKDPVDPLVVNLTAKWQGRTGDFIKVAFDAFGTNTLAARLLSATPMSGGIGGGVLAGGIAALGDEQFDVIVVNTIYNEALDLIDSVMDGISGRWSPFKQLYGHVFSAHGLGFGDAVKFGRGRNGPHASTLAVAGAHNPVWEWAAVLGALAAGHWANPPELSRPLQTLTMKGLLAPPILDLRWDIAERQSLIANGMSTYRLHPVTSNVTVDRIVTHRRTNDFGDPDTGWRDAITMFQAMYFVRRMRQAITNSFPRAALTDKETGIAGFASPAQIRDTIIHEYKEMTRIGLVERPDVFAEGLVVERNPIDPNRVDALFRPDLVNQLRIVAALVQTNLETSSSEILAA